ncbi:MAG: lysophospholipid acyltransferase family protein [Nitrosomonadales bacterium]|nr:MAG: lysophospholipid acyltransferase family protein [Nitrosomonadales bacterium]
MLLWLLRLFARLPLPVIHALGVAVGWALYFGLPKDAARMQENLRTSGLCPDEASFRRMLRRNVAESGKGLLETFAIWFRSPQHALLWVRACHGWDHVEAALAAGRGIIFLTPHLGCFEIAALYYAAHHPINVLYRPPRKAWLAPLIQTGRARGQYKLAPTNMKGVRGLLQSLKRGEAIGILPDQVPSTGEGEWAPFFGRPAYTMTLVSRLAEATDAAVFMVFGERLRGGKGYALHFRPLPEGSVTTAAALNASVEQLIRQCPEQYLWGYHRFKAPRGAAPVPAAAGALESGH